MMGRSEVNGGSAHPLYKWLTKEARAFWAQAIKWNFTKFLVTSKNGESHQTLCPDRHAQEHGPRY
jgi:glutathione peroxidase